MANKNKVDTDELVLNAEAGRDAKWVECLSLYVPTVRYVYEQDDSTLEKIIDHFVEELNEQKKPKSQHWGQVDINLPS